jgi:hypothetical protein
MGGSFTKVLSPPVNMKEWESLQREAIRIRMALSGLIQDAEKWPVFTSEYEQRWFTIIKQWQIVYSMLLQMIKTNHVYDISNSLEWAKQIRAEMDRLARRYMELRKAKLPTIDEKEESLLDEKNDFVE